MPERHSFKLEVLGRYPARLRGNEPAVTANLVAGDENGHLVYAGTVTMSEGQFDSFVGALKRGADGSFEVDDWQAPEE